MRILRRFTNLLRRYTMTITTFANDRDVGNMNNGEHLTSALDFYTLNTTVALSIDDLATDTELVQLVNNADLIRIGEIIGIQAQPVITSLKVITSPDNTVYGL